jgi:short-subunit dehydrogenase
MRFRPKPLREQVLVITGATSGIGLATARQAANGGARLVLNSRDEAALAHLIDEIDSSRRRALAVVGDVGKYSDVKRIADEAINHFGRFDTWINNAAVSIYGRVWEVDLEDHRRLFDTNYWGVVHGSLAAMAHLRKRGGMLINVGSTLSDRAIPLQGTYCASKHAVKGFTDALRMELEKEGAPVYVTLIKPSSIDTPYRQHAKVYLPVEPLNPPPVYAPEVVARTILYCVEHPKRDVFIGAGGKALSLFGQLFPRWTDSFLRAFFFWLQKSEQPANPQRIDSLHNPMVGGHERGGYPGHVAKSSAYTASSLHPVVTGALAIAGALAVLSWLRNRT